jgi:uncharacterized membrane protein (DUF485 family)
MNASTSRPAATADDHPEISAANTRAGLVLFFFYLAFYAGFVLLAAFSPETMAMRAIGGVNLAITYGMALIFGAFVVAALYMGACAYNARRFAATDGRERQP